MEFTAKLHFHRIPDFFVADMHTKDMELFSHEILLTFGDMDKNIKYNIKLFYL